MLERYVWRKTGLEGVACELFFSQMLSFLEVWRQLLPLASNYLHESTKSILLGLAVLSRLIKLRTEADLMQVQQISLFDPHTVRAGQHATRAPYLKTADRIEGSALMGPGLALQAL